MLLYPLDETMFSGEINKPNMWGNGGGMLISHAVQWFLFSLPLLQSCIRTVYTEEEKQKDPWTNARKENIWKPSPQKQTKYYFNDHYSLQKGGGEKYTIRS